MGWFSRGSAQHDRTSPGLTSAEAAARVAANAPAAVLPGTAERFAEIYGSSKVQAQRWFLVAMASLALAFASLLGIVSLLPLKEVRPWVVEIEPATGLVNRPVEVIRVDPNAAVVKAELARWAEAVYTLDPLRSRELLRWANTRTADKAVAQFTEFRLRERIAERLSTEKQLVRQAKVTAVDASQNGTAFIFITTTERWGGPAPAGDVVRRFRVTVNYRLQVATQEADLLANPLGLFITHFADAEERAP
jgi:type IV secretion system protein TrbF